MNTKLALPMVVPVTDGYYTGGLDAKHDAGDKGHQVDSDDGGLVSVVPPAVVTVTVTVTPHPNESPLSESHESASLISTETLSMVSPLLSSLSSLATTTTPAVYSSSSIVESTTSAVVTSTITTASTVNTSSITTPAEGGGSLMYCPHTTQPNVWTLCPSHDLDNTAVASPPVTVVASSAAGPLRRPPFGTLWKSMRDVLKGWLGYGHEVQGQVQELNMDDEYFYQDGQYHYEDYYKDSNDDGDGDTNDHTTADKKAHGSVYDGLLVSLFVAEARLDSLEQLMQGYLDLVQNLTDLPAHLENFGGVRLQVVFSRYLRIMREMLGMMKAIYSVLRVEEMLGAELEGVGGGGSGSEKERV